MLLNVADAVDRLTYIVPPNEMPISDVPIRYNPVDESELHEKAGKLADPSDVAR